MYTNGNALSEFNNQVCKITESKFCFATSSATTALWACLKILEIKKGDEVIISDFSYPATANVVEDLGAKPIFTDVSLDTFNMLEEELKKNISSKTKAVIFVDALGNPSGVNNIQKVCKNYGIPLIEDAACALGSSENDKKCGSISDLTCFSFHPRKIVCAGEGGAITTNNKLFAEKLRLKLSHGSKLSKDGQVKFVDFGYNFRLSEIQAAMALIQLKKINSIIKKRLELLETYKKFLIPLGFKHQMIGNSVKFNVQSVTFIVPDNISASSLISKLKQKQIDCTIGTYSLSSTDYYLKKYKKSQQNSVFLMKNSITFPCFETLNIEYIINEVKKFLND